VSAARVQPAAGPETRITAIPARPGAVESAKIVSCELWAAKPCTPRATAALGRESVEQALRNGQAPSDAPTLGPRRAPPAWETRDPPRARRLPRTHAALVHNLKLIVTLHESLTKFKERKQKKKFPTWVGSIRCLRCSR